MDAISRRSRNCPIDSVVKFQCSHSHSLRPFFDDLKSNDSLPMVRLTSVTFVTCSFLASNGELEPARFGKKFEADFFYRFVVSSLAAEYYVCQDNCEYNHIVLLPTDIHGWRKVDNKKHV